MNKKIPDREVVTAAATPAVDYAALPSNILEIAGDFQIAWVKEKRLSRPEPVGYYSERYPAGDGIEHDD